MEKFELRETVRKKYANVAIGANKCCCGEPSSCAACVCCLAGASLKEDYLAMQRQAGFTQVELVGESSFNIGEMANDPMVAAILEEARLGVDQAREAGRSVVSLKVIARKAA